MHPAIATLTNKDNASFDRAASEGGENQIFATLSRRARRLWLGLPWRAQTLAFGLLMTVSSFSLSMLAAFIGSL